MNTSHKTSLLKRNSLLWIVAMIMPAFFSITLGSTKFPWQVVVPLLFLGLMLASNKMLMQAMEEPVDQPKAD